MKSQHPSSIICPYNNHFQPMNMMYAEATNALRYILKCLLKGLLLFITIHQICKTFFFRVLERNLTLGKMKNKIQLLKTKLGKKPRSKSRKKLKKKRRKVPRKGRSSKRSKKKRKKSRSNRLRKKSKAGPNRRRGWRG